MNYFSKRENLNSSAGFALLACLPVLFLLGLIALASWGNVHLLAQRTKRQLLESKTLNNHKNSLVSKLKTQLALTQCIDSDPEWRYQVCTSGYRAPNSLLGDAVTQIGSNPLPQLDFQMFQEHRRKCTTSPFQIPPAISQFSLTARRTCVGAQIERTANLTIDGNLYSPAHTFSITR